ncbi:DUF4968 domain-containing protein, partial [Lacticaseibacillus rhamnosus]
LIYLKVTHAVTLEVIADNIIRVIAAPGKELVPTQSLITVYHKRPDLSWDVVPTASRDSLSLKTRSLEAIVDLKTGAVTFLDVMVTSLKLLSAITALNDRILFSIRFWPRVAGRRLLPAHLTLGRKGEKMAADFIFESKFFANLRIFKLIYEFLS